MKYPIYIPSSGRPTSQKTVSLLESNGITNYKVIVEKAEAGLYEETVNRKNLLILPGDKYGTSSVARNFAIEHSIKQGFKKHWQMDDDITKVAEHIKAKTVSTDAKQILGCVEVISDGYPTVGITGIHFANFLSGITKPVSENTMVSGLALVTNTAIRFRGTMYVDRDYVLQCLKRGYTTVKCNDYYFAYIATLKQKGGYFETYNDDAKRLASINEFLKNHPEIDPTVERHPLGFLHLKNIAGIWRKYQIKNNK